MKLTAALARLMEEDPSLKLEHAKDTHQMVLWGQGEMHLRVALERLKRKYWRGGNVRASPAALQGDDPQSGGRCARPAQEAVRRSRPVRRRGARHQAAAARLGLSVRGEASPAAWCRGSSSLGGNRRAGLPAEGAARRLPRGGCLGDADRRLLPFGRFFRHGLPSGRPHRHVRGSAQVQPRPARAGDGGDDRGAERGDRARQRHDPAAARRRPGLRRPRGLARLGHRAGATAASWR